MHKSTVCRIRPVSWKICVQGKEEAEYVRGVLSGARIDSSECEEEHDLTDPLVYSFVASPKGESPLTSVELQAILESDERIELTFD